MPAGVYALALTVFAVGTDKDLIVGVLPTLAKELGVSVPAAGQLATVFALTYALGAPLLAVATANLDRRRTLIAAVAIFAAGNLASAIAPSYALLLAARVLAALGASLYTPAAFATAAHLVRRELTGRALALVTAGFSLASVLGVPLGTLLAVAAGWRASFVMLAVLAVVATGSLLRWLRPVAAPGVVGLADRLSALRDPRVLRLLGVSALAQCAGFSVLLYLGPLLASLAGIGADRLAMLLIVFGIAGLAGNAVAGRATDRFGAQRVLAASLAWIAVVLAVFSLVVSDLPTAVAAVFGWAFGAWMISVPQQARMLRLHPAIAAVALSLNSSAMYLGSAVAGGTGAIVLDAWGVRALPAVAAGITMLAILLFALDLRLARSLALWPPRAQPP